MIKRRRKAKYEQELKEIEDYQVSQAERGMRMKMRLE
jgi:hypothetical protein